MNQRVVITTRQRLEAKIEEMISLLDVLDDDPDLEPEDSGYGDYEGMIVEEQGEPSLGWTAAIDQDVPFRLGDGTFNVDLELDDSDREPNGDELDYSGYMEENIGQCGAGFDGSGEEIALRMLRSLQTSRAAR